MKKSLDLYGNLIIKLEEYGEKDINKILKDAIECKNLYPEEVEEIFKNQEQKITYGVTYGERDGDQWIDALGDDFDEVRKEIVSYVSKCNIDKEIEPYIVIMINGIVVQDSIYGIDVEYKYLSNYTWFDLTKEEQELLLKEVVWIEEQEDDDNSILHFLGAKIEVDKNSTEDNLIFLKNEKFF